MNKRDLYKKYEETFGVKSVLCDAIIVISELGMAITKYLMTHTSSHTSSPLHFNEDFHKAFAEAHIALDQIIEMMGEGEKQLFLTTKHYLLNKMEMDIQKREDET